MCIYVRDKANPNSVKGITVNSETDVIMCLVNPYEQFRNELKEDNEGQVVEIMLKSSRDLRKEYHVDDFEVGNPDHIIDTDKDTEESWDKLQELLNL